MKQRLDCAGGNLLFEDDVTRAKRTGEANQKLFEPQASSFDFDIENLAGRRAISAGIFASFVVRQKKALAAAKDCKSIGS